MQGVNESVKRYLAQGKKPTVYIETTIPSYLTARPSKNRDNAYRQRKTKDWWDLILPKVNPVISRYVTDEARLGDPVAAKRRLAVLHGIPHFEDIPEVTALARELQMKLKIPHRARFDAFHLAMSVVYQVDFVLSWNFEHIVGAPTKLTFAKIGRDMNLLMPQLCTPEELMEV